jgi:hypothetical protein
LKFKYIIIIFNIIIIFFLSAAALVPVFVFGPAFAANFWLSGWPLALILFAALIVLNIFFLFNYRLFMLLEREDWPALAEYLEQRISRKGRYSSRQTRLLINSYLVMNDCPAVLRLENRAAVARPALVEENALLFGAARILGGDPGGAADFFQLRIEKRKTAKRQPADAPWLCWYYGFSLVLAGLFERAEAEFKSLAASSGDALVAGLSAYFLARVLLKYSSNSAECRAVAEQGRERARKFLQNARGWKTAAAGVETEVYAAVIKKYIDQAGAWLFEADCTYSTNSLPARPRDKEQP